MSKEIQQGKYEQGNIYSIVLLLLSAIVSALHSPVIIKATPTFQTVDNDQELCKRTKETKPRDK